MTRSQGRPTSRLSLGRRPGLAGVGRQTDAPSGDKTYLCWSGWKTSAASVVFCRRSPSGRSRRGGQRCCSWRDRGTRSAAETLRKWTGSLAVERTVRRRLSPSSPQRQHSEARFLSHSVSSAVFGGQLAGAWSAAGLRVLLKRGRPWFTAGSSDIAGGRCWMASARVGIANGGQTALHRARRAPGPYPSYCFTGRSSRPVASAVRRVAGYVEWATAGTTRLPALFQGDSRRLRLA